MDTTHPDSKVVLEGTVEPGYERVKQAFGDLVEKGNFCAKVVFLYQILIQAMCWIMMFWEALVATVLIRLHNKEDAKVAQK